MIAALSPSAPLAARTPTSFRLRVVSGASASGSTGAFATPLRRKGFTPVVVETARPAGAVSKAPPEDATKGGYATHTSCASR